MCCQKLPFEKVQQLSTFDKLFANNQSLFEELIPWKTEMKSIKMVISDRQKKPFDRKLIHEILTRQYNSLNINGRNDLIDSLLDDNTYAMVTAHQPYLFGGPLYFITKIISAIKLAQQAKDAFPDNNFVPIFYIGGEDHDLEECNNTTIFQKKILWNTQQSGPIGRMTTDDIDAAIEELCGIMGKNEHAEKLSKLIRTAYHPGRTVNEAMTYFINEFLEDYPLLILNADDVNGKKAFRKIIHQEVLEGIAEPLIVRQQEKMKELGLKPQAFVRPINFFYLSKYGRNRIERKGDRFEIVQTDISFSAVQMEKEIEDYPDRFSPNVIMRPIYQDFLLPTVAYIGGGGELAYWADRKLLFEAFDITMPMLVRRDSFVIVDQTSLKKLEKINISIKELFKDENELKSGFLASQTEVSLSFGSETKALAKVIADIQDKVQQVDPTLKGFVGSETATFFKTLSHIEARVRKALSGKHEIELQQLHSLHQRFFPNNGLQERVESFLSFYVMNGKEIIEKLIECSDPLDFNFKIVES